MLVLSRKRGERIVIDESITITVLEVCGNRVKLGFAAPIETPIARDEIRPLMESPKLNLVPGARYPFVSRSSE